MQLEQNCDLLDFKIPNSSIPKLTLSYFPIGGRAEPIRLACAISKIPFTNISISGAEFNGARTSLPLGQLPTLDLDFGITQRTITQTTSILRYVGKLGGLYPKDDDVAAMEIDEILSILDDLRAPIVLSIMGAVKGLISDDKEFTNDEKMAIRQRWIISKHLPRSWDSLKRNYLREKNLTS